MLRNIVLVIAIAFAGGIAVGVQAPLSGAMGQRIGALESAFIIHLGGAIFAGILLLFGRNGQLGAWQTVPWYMLCAGALGIIVVGSMTFTIPRLGAALAVTLLVLAQMVVSLTLDHFGWLGVAVRPVDLLRLSGVVVLVFGAWLIAQ
ncbi:MAG: DMT family transporter [Chloroflexaceae bacterium]|nr:DMT family transporter [Chloroflexaceae bacterium]NJO04711.1 DMT family transporter [Chloroflexaceae bacterium]